MSISVEFQNQINFLVNSADLKRKDLLEKMRVDERSLSNALNYGIIPTSKILIRMADYFDVSMNNLLGKSDEEFKKSSTPSDFSSRLAFLCKKNNISYHQLDNQCHFGKSYTSRWIRKKSIPSLYILEILTDHFSVSLDYLLGRID